MKKRISIKRIPYGKEKGWTKQLLEEHPYCHDCGAKIGHLHKSTRNRVCDMEECPICHNQLMGDEKGHEGIIFGKSFATETTSLSNRLSDL